MTVKSYEPHDSIDVTCVWFGPNGLEEKSFPQDLLELYQAMSIDDYFDSN